MTRPSLGTAFAASLLLVSAGAAYAQNGTDPAPSTTTTPPAGSDRPSTTSTPPAAEAPTRTEEPAPRTNTEIVTVPVVVPQTQTQATPPPIELQDQAYPNGFADPNAPYGNDLSVAVRQESDGFDWGLLGLLGLLGLFGLYRPRRRDGYREVVHSERYDDGRPPRV